MQTTEATKLYAGADLHGNNVFLSVCESDGTEIFRRRIRADLETVERTLEPYWSRITALGVESTFNWYWFVDGLRAKGHDIKLGNPAQMKQYTGLKSTDDRSDARWLAEMLRLGIFPESYIYPEKTRCVRDALRRRQLFVRRRTQALLSFGSLLTRYGQVAPTARGIRDWDAEQIQATQLDPFVQLQLRTLKEEWNSSNRQAKEVESAVGKFVQPCASRRRIRQVPGIGDTLGMTILLEAGDFRRFKNASCYASYCRTVKSERISNGKKKGENNTRNGNPYLAWAYIEAATFAPRFYPAIQSWYDRKKKQRSPILARKALACKLSKATWHVMHEKDFDMKMMFG